MYVCVCVRKKEVASNIHTYRTWTFFVGSSSSTLFTVTQCYIVTSFVKVHALLHTCTCTCTLFLSLVAVVRVFVYISTVSTTCIFISLEAV